MKKKSNEVNVSGTQEQKTQDSMECLTNHEARNLNYEGQQPALNAGEQINRLVEGIASGTSPTEPIERYKDAVKEALERQYMEFLYAQSMGSWKAWSYTRHLRGEMGLPDEQAHAALEEGYAEFAKRANPREWAIFLTGTPEQKRGLQEAIHLTRQEWKARTDGILKQ